MAVIWTEVFPLGYPLLGRVFLDAPGGPVAVQAPSGAVFVRAAVSGAGGFPDDVLRWGGGAAYAFRAEACAPGDVFTAQIGDSQFSRPTADTVAGDSWVKRPNSTVLVYADRGRHSGTRGLAVNSQGAIRRDGTDATADAGGPSAGDDADIYPLGFGGKGADIALAPYFGGGGGRSTYPGFAWNYPAGDGRVCLEFYRINPGYD